MTSLTEAKDRIAELQDKISLLERENRDLENENSDLEDENRRLEREADSVEDVPDWHGKVVPLAKRALPFITDPLLRYDLESAIMEAEG